MPSTIQVFGTLVTAAALMIGDPVSLVTPQNNPDDLLLVNRDWPISGDYAPDVRVSQVPGQVRKLREEAATALEAMFAACKAETGAQLISVSGYRDYEKQARIYNNKLKRVHGSVEKADEYVARAGTSEHQTGLTMDVGQRSVKDSLGDEFGLSTGGIWIRENCWRFGFILRYDRGWEEITGYEYEPWHVRYVGLAHAAALHAHPQPLETYLLTVRQERFMEILGTEEEIIGVLAAPETAGEEE